MTLNRISPSAPLGRRFVQVPPDAGTGASIAHQFRRPPAQSLDARPYPAARLSCCGSFARPPGTPPDCPGTRDESPEVSGFSISGRLAFPDTPIWRRPAVDDTRPFGVPSSRTPPPARPGHPGTCGRYPRKNGKKPVDDHSGNRRHRPQPISHRRQQNCGRPHPL